MSKEELILKINHITEFIAEPSTHAYELKFAMDMREELQEQLDAILLEEKIAENARLLQAEREAEGDRIEQLLHAEHILRQEQVLAEKKATARKNRKRMLVIPDIRFK